MLNVTINTQKEVEKYPWVGQFINPRKEVTVVLFTAYKTGVVLHTTNTDKEGLAVGEKSEHFGEKSFTPCEITLSSVIEAIA